MQGMLFVSTENWQLGIAS